MDTNIAKYIIGSDNLTSFQGFIAYISFKNSPFCAFKHLALNDCLISEFYSSSCTSCQSQTYPTCTNQINTICHSTSCTSCHGYFSSDCDSCLSPSLELCMQGKNCQTGSGFNCVQCSPGFDQIDGLCKQPASPFTSITLDFDSFSQYKGIYFQSGADPNTYSPFNNPDPDDPIALSQRGYMFNYNQFMIATNITLSHKFSIVAWAYTGTAFIIYCDKIEFMYDASISIKLANFEKEKRESALAECFDVSWKFFGVVVDFYANSTHFSSVCGDKVCSVSSVPGFAFYDSPGDVKITPVHNGSNYIYRMSFIQSAVYDFSNFLTICTVPNSPSCLFYPNIEKYNNTKTGEVKNCSSSCIKGCRTWGTCNQCLDIRCQNCDSFSTQCIVDLNYNPCPSGFQVSLDGKSCCDLRCSECFGEAGYLCTNCSSGFVLIGSVCTYNCPTGYTLVGNVCEKPLENLVLDVKFDKIADSFNDSFGNMFFTGIDGRFYPNGTNSDPIPAKSRGFYFNGSSFIDTSNFSISNNFTVSFCIRQTAPGILLKKGIPNTIFKTETNINTFSTIIYKALNMQFTGIPDNVWVVLNFLGLSSDLLYFMGTSSSTLGLSYGQKNFVFDDKFSSMRIGSDTGGFQGFIWRIYIKISIDLGYIPTICSFNTLTDCLWDCDLNYYFNNIDCSSCSIECSQGCVRGQDCNFCMISGCSSCKNFDYECTSCLNSFTGSSGCRCTPGNYWDTQQNKCQVCLPNCLLCQDSSTCSECKPTFTNTQTSCICNSNQYIFNNICNLCSSQCKTCNGPLPTDCTSCGLNTTLVSNECLCNAGFYFNNSQCEKCSDTCLHCSSLSTCFNCDPKFILNNGLCVCPTHTVFVGGVCVNCSESCNECSGITDKNCTSCGSYKNLQSGQCLCDDGFYLDKNVC